MDRICSHNWSWLEQHIWLCALIVRWKSKVKPCVFENIAHQMTRRFCMYQRIPSIIYLTLSDSRLNNWRELFTIPLRCVARRNRVFAGFAREQKWSAVCYSDSNKVKKSILEEKFCLSKKHIGANPQKPPALMGEGPRYEEVPFDFQTRRRYL